MVHIVGYNIDGKPNFRHINDHKSFKGVPCPIQNPPF